MYDNTIKKELRERRGILNWINLTQYNYCIHLSERMKKWQFLSRILMIFFVI
jgi:hypothetical protein